MDEIVVTLRGEARRIVGETLAYLVAKRIVLRAEDLNICLEYGYIIQVEWKM